MAGPRALQSALAPQAYGFAIALGVGAALCLVVGWNALGTVLLVGTAFNFWFFRNPRRVAPEGEHRILAPGDGRVVEVATLPQPDPFVGPAKRIAIFLSVFDVHVNHVPLTGKVRAITRSGTKFKAAFDGEASALNVQSRMDLDTHIGARMAVIQITGLIARRIVCYAHEGETVERGDPYGLICYGSRMELIVPADTRVLVERGARVRSGETVLAEWGG